jgi:hypothetical protein
MRLQSHLERRIRSAASKRRVLARARRRQLSPETYLRVASNPSRFDLRIRTAKEIYREMGWS